MRRWADSAREWSPPAGWTKVFAIDAHTAGEPLRVILDGFPHLYGETILARRRSAKEAHDDLRRALMWEPRGHADMYGCLVVSPVTAEADFGVLFTHNEGYSTMCGHGIIGVATVAVEIGLVDRTEPSTRIGIDTPAGFVEAHVTSEGGSVRSASFINVPSFAVLDLTVDVAGVGAIRYDLGFGGAFYAYVDAGDVGVDLSPGGYRDLIERGRAIKDAIQAADAPRHPDEEEMSFLYGTIFVGPPKDSAHHSRNVCVFADGEVDRSPTGTGVAGRVAIHHARGEVAIGETLEIESILGTTFTATVRETTKVGGHAAVVPEVGGRAHITGRNELWIDPEDPLRGGFFLR